MNHKMKYSSQPSIAAPLSAPITDTQPSTRANSTQVEDKRILLIKLSDAAARIRDEAELIRRTGFTDRASRLLRILGETVEEQRVALGKNK